MDVCLVIQQRLKELGLEQRDLAIAAMVEAQRQEEWKRKLTDPLKPLYQEVREVVIRKCRRERQKQVRAIFEKLRPGRFAWPDS